MFDKVKLNGHRDVAQLGSAPALGAGCPRFKSWYPDFLMSYEVIEEKDNLIVVLIDCHKDV